MSIAQAKSRLGVEEKRARKRPDDEARQRVAEARRALAEEKLKAYIESVVASAPELSAEARTRLAGLLKAGPQ